MTNKNIEINNEDKRVLSVSYGSFSIQLQGFADPFVIMKRVTEYFRVISLENPSFGSKPLIEDVSILENLNSTAFGDDIEFSNEGTTLTLTPADEHIDLVSVEPLVEPTPETFVLEEQLIETTLFTDDVFDIKSDTNMEPTLELENIAADEEFIEEEVVFFEEETVAEEVVVEDAVSDEVEDLVAEEAIEAPIEELVIPAQDDAEPISATEHSAASLEAAIANALLNPKPAAPKQEAPKEPEADVFVENEELRSMVAAAMTKASEASKSPAPVETPEPEAATEEPTRKFRIIRNDYDYDETASVEPTVKTTVKTLSVNPFRKFPVKNATLSTEPQVSANEPVEAAEDAPTGYRKLRI
jgi:hypothetical protein